MAMDKLQTQNSNTSITTVQQSYKRQWGLAFAEVMDILAARFRMILYQGKPPEVKPTPMLNLWRESLEDLSPAQMRAGLKNYLNSEAGHFEPSPGDIRASAPAEATDKPRVKAREDCPSCDGTS